MATRASVYPHIDRTALAKTLDMDRGYVTKLLNGTRDAPLSVSLAIFRETGVKLGILIGKKDSEIKELARAQSVIENARSAAE